MFKKLLLITLLCTSLGAMAQTYNPISAPSWSRKISGGDTTWRGNSGGFYEFASQKWVNKNSLFSKRIIYAKQFGAALNSDINSGGGTNDAKILQAAIDTLHNRGGGVLAIDGVGTIDTTLIWRSNVAIVGTYNGAGLFLASNSNAHMITTVLTGQTISNYNIRMENLILNGNCDNQNRWVGRDSVSYGREWVTGMWIGSTDGYILNNVTIRNARTFALPLSQSYNGAINNITFIWDNPDTFFNNHDSFHFWGTLDNLVINGVTSTGGDDDVIPFNTDECMPGTTFGEFEGPRRGTTSEGITNVTVMNVKTHLSGRAVRFIGYGTSGAYVDNINLYNFSGDVYFGMNWTAVDSAGRIAIQGWNVKDSGGQSQINIAGGAESLSLSDIAGGTNVILGAIGQKSGDYFSQPASTKLTAIDALANANGVLTNNGSGGFSYTTPSIGTVTSVSSANSDIGVATGTTTPVLTLNSGTGANQIVKRDGSGNLNSTTATALATSRTIGAVTGDVTSAGSSFDGTANNTNTLTLATVNSNAGSFGNATNVSAVTVNGKGLVTSASNTPIQIAESQVTNLTTDLAGKANLAGGNTFTNNQIINGSVGIGTSSPLVITGFNVLEVKGSSAGLIGVSSSAGAAFGRIYSNGSDVIIGSSSPHPVILDYNDVEKARITSTGFEVTGTIKSTGLDNYTSDLSGSYTSRSKVDKAYVDAKLTSGTYTPTTTNGTNVTASNGITAYYTRVGDIVTVSGTASITPTSTGAGNITISLPIASNLAGTTDVSGIGMAYINNNITNATLQANTGTDTADMTFTVATAVVTNITFTFTYKVI